MLQAGNAAIEEQRSSSFDRHHCRALIKVVLLRIHAASTQKLSFSNRVSKGSGPVGPVCLPTKSPQVRLGRHRSDSNGCSRSALQVLYCTLHKNTWREGGDQSHDSEVHAPEFPVDGVRSGYVAGLVAPLKISGHDMILTAFRFALNCGLIRVRASRVCRSAPAWRLQQRLWTYCMWYQSFARAATILRLPLSHTALRQLPLFSTGCPGLAMNSGRGSGVARAGWSCTLCGACPRQEMHLMFDCAALQVLRDDLPNLRIDLPNLFWGVHTTGCS